jgi:hypothetical protein
VTRPLILPLLALAALVPGAAASAQTPEAPGDASQVRRLSPEQKEQILAENERRRAEAAELDTALGGSITRPSGIHGEIGAEIGTGGTRGIFGSALVPLGDRGAAAFSFENYRTRTLDPGLLDQFYVRRPIAPR